MTAPRAPAAPAAEAARGDGRVITRSAATGDAVRLPTVVGATMADDALYALQAADAAGYARAMADARAAVELRLERAHGVAQLDPENERVGHYADGIACALRALAPVDDGAGA